MRRLRDLVELIIRLTFMLVALGIGWVLFIVLIGISLAVLG